MSSDTGEIVGAEEGESPSVAELRGSATRGGATLVASRLTSQLISWLITIQIARLLRPYDYGIVGLGMIIVNLADLLADSGVGKALVQKERVGSADVDQIFTLSLMISASLYAVLYFAAVPAAGFLETPELVKFLRVTGVIILMIPFHVIPSAMLNRRMQIGRQSVILALNWVIQSCLVLGLAFAGFGYWALAIGVILGRFLEAASLYAMVPWTFRLRRPGADARALFLFGIQVSGSALLWYFYSNSDFVTIGKLEGAAKLGYYSMAFQLISLPVLKMTSVYNSISYPVFCRLSGEPDLICRWHIRSISLMMAAGAPALIGLALVSDDAITLILGVKWLPASIPLQILSTAGILMIIHGTFPPLFQSLGRPDIDLRCTLALAIIMPTSFVLAGTYWGTIGVCSVWVTVFPVLFGGIVTLTRRVTGFGLADLCRPLVPVALSLVLMTAAVLTVRWLLADCGQLPVRLGATIAVGVLIYCGTLWCLMKQTLLNDYRTIRGSLRSG